MQSVPYLNLGKETSLLKEELMKVVGEVLESGMYILGPQVSSFEREFAAYCGSEFSLGVDNGTTALLLTMRAWGLGENDEVITAPNSFIASASSVALAGARPVFADIGPDLNLDPEKVEAAITPRTRAIMPVHLTGRPAKMEALLDIARRHRLFVLEDAAQAVGAKIDGKKVGSFGDASSFSLHPMKNLHAFGDGGMITLNSRQLYETLIQARNHGLKNRNECDYWSYNCRLDELQAALLRVQLKHLDQQTEERRKLAFRYHKLLKPYGAVPEEGPQEFCVYQTYVIQVERRDELLKFLNDRGVEARIHYPIPIHLQPAARSLGYSAKDFPETMRAASRILSLPLYPSLAFEQQDWIAQLFKEFYGR
ncbi:MAG: DegT/DnrJ/EryC1/StrS family aminotransferase [Bdellovibrionota bacterium]